MPWVCLSAMHVETACDVELPKFVCGSQPWGKKFLRVDRTLTYVGRFPEVLLQSLLFYARLHC